MWHSNIKKIINNNTDTNLIRVFLNKNLIRFDFELIESYKFLAKIK